MSKTKLHETNLCEYCGTEFHRDEYEGFWYCPECVLKELEGGKENE